MKAGNGSFDGPSVRRLAAAAAVALALATAATAEDDSQAQLPTLQTPSLEIDAPGVTVELPPVEVAPPPVAPPDVTPPPAPVDPPRLPVNPPPLPTPSPTPINPPPVRLNPPALPGAPSSPTSPGARSLRDVLPSLPGGQSLPSAPSGSSPVSGPQLPSLTDPLGAAGTPGSGGSALSTTASPAAIAGALTAIAPGVADLPTRSELAKLPAAERRRLLRLAFDTPLSRRPLRALRNAIRAYRGCLGLLSDRGRRALELRAGLLGEQPASRREVARRIGTSPTAELRLERSALRRLIGAGRTGRCDDVSSVAAAAAGGPASGSDGGAGRPPARGGATDPLPASDVLADAHEGGPGIDLYDGEQGPAETLLFFLVVLVALFGPLVAIALVGQRRARNGAASAANERPLLFLDVDGVIALNPFSRGLPPGRLHASPFGGSYVPDRVGELVRELATHFDIVWTTGWEHHANASLLSALGLRDELPVITFGRKARTGPSTWKIKPVDAYAGHRPAAWLDDSFVGRHERWAAHRSEPTLLVRVDSDTGLAPDHVERLLRWADRVAPAKAEASNGERRLSAR